MRTQAVRNQTVMPPVQRMIADSRSRSARWSGSALRVRLSSLLFLLSSLLVLLTTPGCGMETSSAAPAVDILHRMLAAEKSVEYEAMRRQVRFYESGERRSFFFVRHYRNGPTLVESMGRQGYPEWPGRSGGWVERFGRLYWLADKELLLKNYIVTEKGRRTISEREGIVLDVSSRHKGRPSIEVVVDAETNLLLAAEFRNYRGQAAFRSELQSLLLDPDLPVREPTRGWKGQRRTGDVERVKGGAGEAPSFTVLEPQFLPVGFVRKSSWKSRRSDRLNLMYSDGLTWIHLSLAKAEPGATERVVEQTRCGSRTTMQMAVYGVSVRLVGRLDPAVLLKVLGSLKGRTES